MNKIISCTTNSVIPFKQTSQANRKQFQQVSVQEKNDEFVSSNKSSNKKDDHKKQLIGVLTAIAGIIIGAVVCIKVHAKDSAKSLDSVREQVSKVIEEQDKPVIEKSKDAVQKVGETVQQTTDNVINTAKEYFVDLSDKLLPRFKDKQITDMDNITPENLVAVRRTNFVPENNTILSCRDGMRGTDGVGGLRNTVHFSINHVVKDNNAGYSWGNMKYSILSPMNELIAANGSEKFIGGMPNDFMSAGSVKLTPNTVIVRQNPNVPKGKLRVVNSEDIDEFKNVKGIKVVESSNDLQEITDTVIKKMGYTIKDSTNPYGWGHINGLKDSEELSKNINSWRTFTAKNGMKEFMHLYHPSSRAEHIVEGIEFLTQNNSWTISKNGKEILDYKAKLLATIKDLKNYQKQGYNISYDIDKMEEIIKTSATPKDAITAIKMKLKLKPIQTLEEAQKSIGRNLTSQEVYANLEMRVGISDEAKKFNQMALDYFNKPSVNADDIIQLDSEGASFSNGIINSSLYNELQGL